MVTRFRSDGSILTTKTHKDGTVEGQEKSYRIVGSTLIFSKTDPVINTRYEIDGDRLILDTGEASIVIKRI